MFVYECLQHCYWSANSCYSVLKGVAISLLWCYTVMTLNLPGFRAQLYGGYGVLIINVRN